jgi:hypothetical protein
MPPWPNDTEFSGERKRVRCNELLGPRLDQRSRGRFARRCGPRALNRAPFPDALTLPETSRDGTNGAMRHVARMYCLRAWTGRTMHEPPCTPK